MRFWFCIWSFWLDRGLTMSRLYYQFYTLANKPDGLYPVAVRMLIKTALPFAFMGSIPARVLTHRGSWTDYVLVISVLIAYSGFVVFLWKRGLRRYQSASSWEREMHLIYQPRPSLPTEILGGEVSCGRGGDRWIVCVEVSSHWFYRSPRRPPTVIRVALNKLILGSRAVEPKINFERIHNKPIVKVIPLVINMNRAHFNLTVAVATVK